METVWSSAVLSRMAGWGSKAQDVILTEFSRKVKECPDSFGIPIPDSEFLSTAVQEKEFFVFSERMPENGLVLVVAVTRKPTEDREAVVYEIARLKSELPFTFD